MKILHCITSLDRDGAQQMLGRLISRLNASEFEHVVVSLRERMPFAEELEALGVQLYCLEMSPGKPSLKALRQLRGIIARESPDLIQGWLYHANCAVTLAVLCQSPRIPVIWGIRGSLDRGWGRGFSTRLMIKFTALLSRLPQVVTFNSKLSIEQHRRAGYRASDVRYIPNGFDLKRFVPDCSLRQCLVDQYNLPADGLLIGIAGRYNQAKDYPGFLRAFRLLVDTNPEVHAIMIGRDVESSNPELSQIIGQLNLARQVTLLGAQPDLGQILPALDIFCSSSVTEGFPNVVAEALACAVPCVVTDVGMSAELVSNAGLSVAASDPEALSQGLRSLVAISASDRARLGAQGREKICREFELGVVVEQYQDLYRDVLKTYSSK